MIRKRKIKSVPIYGQFSLTIMSVEDVGKTITKIIKQDHNDFVYSGVFLSHPNNTDLYIIIAEDQMHRHDIIAHEALHATFHIMKDVGMKISDDSEESFTYLHGYIVKECYKTFEK